MSEFIYPDESIGRKLIEEFGGNPDKVLICQDWEYTYPKITCLDKYIARYEQKETTDKEKRILTSFIFQACDDLLRENYAENETCVREILSTIFKDIEITKYEFNYWSSWDTEEKEFRWFISEITREFKIKTEE